MIFVAILLLVIGFAALVKGADVFVDGAAALAGRFGIPQLVIGLTIVAMGTSLPEAAVSITAGMKGNAGIAIGNIVGSNIFNILFVIGMVALICPVPFESRFVIDTIIAIACGVLLWGGTIRHKELRKPCGIVMLVGYVIYFVYLAVV